jgi:hypothetical protein
LCCFHFHSLAQIYCEDIFYVKLIRPSSIKSILGPISGFTLSHIQQQHQRPVQHPAFLQNGTVILESVKDVFCCFFLTYMLWLFFIHVMIILHTWPQAFTLSSSNYKIYLYCSLINSSISLFLLKSKIVL